MTRPRLPVERRPASFMDYETYASPFSWRYGRAALRALFSEKSRRRLWRAVWVALAEAQSLHGLIDEAEVEDLRAHAGEIDLEAALEIEREIHHDLDGRNSRFRDRRPSAAAASCISAQPRWTSRTRSKPIECGLRSHIVGEIVELLAAFGGADPRARRLGVHGIHPSATGRADDVGLPA